MRELNSDHFDSEEYRVRSEFRDCERKRDILEKLKVITILSLEFRGEGRKHKCEGSHKFE